ncbi:AAA family ATPase [Faecalibaculum rodentium]|uniref:AAA family ATPase n=1 Tax=Faecalibaculum rodentium TaxID=1702221 RepID=UPI00273108CE|nr:AAA family ATPase [Faecalibaculum rodentium]
MLKQFNFKNFLSFDEDEGRTNELSLIGSRVRRHPEQTIKAGDVSLLKAALIYGANGSGKSNLIKAIQFMKACVLRGVPAETAGLYDRTSRRNQNMPSYFEMEILLDGICYCYGFELLLASGSVLCEWLIRKNTSGETVLFERSTDKGTFRVGGELEQSNTKDTLGKYLEDFQTDQDILLLHVMNRTLKSVLKRNEKLRVFEDLFLWYARDLNVIWPETSFTNYFQLIEHNPTSALESWLQAFDTGITRIDHRKVTYDQISSRLRPEEAQVFRKALDESRTRCHKDPAMKAQALFRTRNDMYLCHLTAETEKFVQLVFVHQGTEGDVEFTLADESEGTIRILDLLDVLLSEEEKVFVIDELDRCLHPNLVYRFVKLFLRKAGCRSQLICTTHESALLDFDLVRRDEIWFINKNREGNSHLYSMEEYNERFDKVIEKAYREGRYGGVPVFHSVFPFEGEEPG